MQSNLCALRCFLLLSGNVDHRPNVHSCAGSDLDDTDNIDIVSKGADPNGMLHKRGSNLEPRAKDKFTSPNAKQLDSIKQATKIAFPNDFHTIDSLKQARNHAHSVQEICQLQSHKRAHAFSAWQSCWINT